MTDKRIAIPEGTVEKSKGTVLSRVKLVTAILLGVLIIIFGIQNNKTIALKFAAWEFETNIILLIFLVLAIGGAIVAIVTLTSLAKKHKETKRLNKEIKELKDRIIKNDRTSS
ncbi:MAG: LapA family protein [Spirochaetota bacterium]|nr:LapA family protein [Spirochaetota bacterium]